MSPAKRISANVNQFVSLFSSKSLLGLPISFAEATGAPLRACEALRPCPTLRTILQLFPRSLFFSHAATVCWTPLKVLLLGPFLLPILPCVPIPKGSGNVNLCVTEVPTQTLSQQRAYLPCPLGKRTNSFSVSFLALRFYIIRLLMHLFIFCNGLLFLPRVWTELKQQPHLVHNP